MRTSPARVWQLITLIAKQQASVSAGAALAMKRRTRRTLPLVPEARLMDTLPVLTKEMARALRTAGRAPLRPAARISHRSVRVKSRSIYGDAERLRRQRVQRLS